MALYTFHAFNAHDAPVAFEAAEAADDAAALVIADHLLREHASAHRVLVCLGDWEVADRHRVAIGAQDGS